MNWYDGVTEAQIQEMKENKEPFELMDEWKKEAFTRLRRKRPDDILFWNHLAKWERCDGIPALCNPADTYRLSPTWSRPVEKKGYEEVVVDVVVKSDGLVYCSDNVSLVGASLLEYNGKDYHQAVYAYELPFYGNPSLWTKNHIMFSNGKSLKDAPTEEWIVPVHPIQVRGARWE